MKNDKRVQIQSVNLVPSNRATSNNRASSTNRANSANNRASINKVNSDKDKFASKTFAEMLLNSKTQPSTIRNMRIVAQSEEDRKRIGVHLANNYACQDVGIRKITSKSVDFMTIKCKTEADAKKLEDTLKTNYGTDIDISKVKDSDPKFKIVGVALPDNSPSQFILNLKEQNEWLKNTEINYVEHFEVPSKRGAYTNVVLSCDMPTLRRVLEKNEVICGLDMKRVFEHIDIVQCFNCQRFGHVANSCKANPSCKFCAEDHQSKLCDDRENYACINCHRENKSGQNLNFKHRATDERCKLRGARIEGLKDFASKN